MEIEETASIPITAEMGAILDSPIQDPVSAAFNLIVNCPVYLPPAQPLSMDIPLENVPNPVNRQEIVTDNNLPDAFVPVQSMPDSTGLSVDSQLPVQWPNYEIKFK